MKSVRRFRRMLEHWQAMQIRTYAGSASFFLLLSLFPLMSLLLGILPRAGCSGEDLAALLLAAIPGELTGAFSLLLQALDAGSSRNLISLSTATLIVSASAGVKAILHGLNEVLRLPETRPYPLQLGLSLLCTLGVLACILVTLILNVWGRWLILLFPARSALRIALSELLEHSSFLTVVLLSAVFSLLYLLLPNRRTRLRRVIPGALAAALIWMLFSLVFSFCVGRFGKYSRLYGSLASCVVLMLWLFSCMYILFFGALLNRFLQQRRKKRKKEVP